jgi:hypothetical protein
MTSHNFAQRREYFDDYIEYGLKSGTGRHSASSTQRAALLRSARVSMRIPPPVEQPSFWARLQRKLRAGPVDPTPAGLIVFGFAWVWAFRLTTTPMSNVR